MVDGEPTRCGTAISDVLAGLFACIGVISAQRKAEITQVGQKVDVALVDSVVAGMEIINQIYLAEGVVPGRNGNRYESIYPYDSFKCSDGSIVIGAGNDKLYHTLCHLMKQPELITDERFLHNPLRIKNSHLLKEIVEAWSIQYTMDELIDMLLDVGIPAGPINTIDRVVADPHIADSREMFVEMVHPIAGKLKITGNPIKMSDDSYNKPKSSPLLGEHNLDVLQKYLDLSEEQVKTLKDNGVI